MVIDLFKVVDLSSSQTVSLPVGNIVNNGIMWDKPSTKQVQDFATSINQQSHKMRHPGAPYSAVWRFSYS